MNRHKKTGRAVTCVTTPKKQGLDYWDFSVLGPLTDLEKWRIICGYDSIPLHPTVYTNELKVEILEYYLFAFKLSESDFTVDGMLKGH